MLEREMDMKFPIAKATQVFPALLILLSPLSLASDQTSSSPSNLTCAGSAAEGVVAGALWTVFAGKIADKDIMNGDSTKPPAGVVLKWYLTGIPGSSFAPWVSKGCVSTKTMKNVSESWENGFKDVDFNATAAHPAK
jgi:hypothetical protein